MNWTIFIDIDGTILEHFNGGASEIIFKFQRLLPKVRETFDKWREQGHYICITTARPECLREITVKQLLTHGLLYDQLVMGITHGPRMLINDAKPNMEYTAYAYTVDRNEGLGDVKLE